MIDAASTEGVAQICRRLDGVPLAIELAAARVTAMNPSELARRLDRRFRLLSGGDRVAIERHQTLRATIDWSYDLLTAPEQRLLDRLSVFGQWLHARGGRGSVRGRSDRGRRQVRVVGGSCLVTWSRSTTPVRRRYRLLETIRQYGETPRRNGRDGRPAGPSGTITPVSPVM